MPHGKDCQAVEIAARLAEMRGISLRDRFAALRAAHPLPASTGLEANKAFFDVQEELSASGTALPWVDKIAFARRAVAMALADWASVCALKGWVFFDRSLIDAAVNLQHLTGEPALAGLGQSYRYHQRVFLTPPWPEVYTTDPERRHDLADALAEYSYLLEAYPSLGYEVFLLPKVGVTERADFVLSTLAA